MCWEKNKNLIDIEQLISIVNTDIRLFFHFLNGFKRLENYLDLILYIQKLK